MSRTISILTLAILSIICAADEPIYQSDFGPRTSEIFPHPLLLYDINLDLGYEDRWREVMADKGPAILKKYNHFIEKTKISEETVNSVNYTVVAAHDLEYAKELLALANLLSIRFEQLVFLNVFFNAAPRCSGAIVQDADDNIYHGRNLDFYNFGAFDPMMFEARYWKNGKLLYRGISGVSQIGVFTAVKKGSFALNFNQYYVPFKYDGDPFENVKYLIYNIYSEFLNSYHRFLNLSKKQFLKKSVPIRSSALMLIRRVMENCDTFDEAVQVLTTNPLLGKAIYVLSGTKKGEGVVIVRTKDVVHNQVYLNADQGIWYLVQSNYRRDIGDPPYDNRRSGGEAQLDEIGRENITKELLWSNVMTKYPLFNNGTLYTSLMQASTGEFETTVWGWKKDKKYIPLIEQKKERMNY